MPKPSFEQRRRSIFARTPTAELIKAVRALEAQQPGPDRNLALDWTIQELERRFPDAKAAVEAAFAEADRKETYDADEVAVLLAAIPNNTVNQGRPR